MATSLSTPWRSPRRTRGISPTGHGGGRLVRAAGLAVLLLALLLRPAAGQDAAPLTLAEADSRLAIAERMIQGGIYDRAMDLADSVLNDPAAQGFSGSSDGDQSWLERREFARFLLDRGRLGIAATQEEILDAAASLVQLANNRYRLANPSYNIQAAYWAGRAYETAGDYQDAIDYYSRVGGITLPQDMEGDAAQRMSRCLRLLAEDIPYPGNTMERQRRERLLNQAIGELDRARLAFPVGNRRKEIELDLIALRLARREEQYIREAVTEAESFMEADPAKDELRARAVLYRGQASALLGLPAEAAAWFSRVLGEEAPSDDDRRAAELGLALVLVELAETAGPAEKNRFLVQATAALDKATAGAVTPGRWDGARIIKARLQLELDQPTAALDTLSPILQSSENNAGAWLVAGSAEWRRGRLAEAIAYFLPASRPSVPARDVRYSARRDGARAADAKRDYGLAIALAHHASGMLREDRLFPSLLVSEFLTMETILKLGKMGGPVSLSGDIDLLTSDSRTPIVPIDAMRAAAGRDLAAALGRLLGGGGDSDTGYDLSVRSEAAWEWAGDSLDKLELAIGMISHLRRRQPGGVTDSVLTSRLGEARQALALGRAERILAAEEPSESDIDRTLGDFAAASAAFQEAAAAGFSARDSLDQGMVNMESGAFLKRLAERWDRGVWSGKAALWRDEARKRIEASIRPFNQTIATSGPGSVASRRARWSRGRALELLGEWRGAATDFLSLMNNSELPRVLRANAARRWAVCMGELGESRQALFRLAVFADIDAEAALLAGRLAEAAGLPREAYQRYLFAANPDSPSLPPYTPDRVREAAYNAARIALAAPREADPLQPVAAVVAQARDLLHTSAFSNLGGAWAVPALNLLGESWIGEADGWQTAHSLARAAIEPPESDDDVDRALHILAARALITGQEYARALDELDAARELLDSGPLARVDAARITLETARVYRLQERYDDALRAFTDVFAVYHDVAQAEDAARREAAEMLLTLPDSGPTERERAASILRGLRDQIEASRILRDHGIR